MKLRGKKETEEKKSAEKEKEENPPSPRLRKGKEAEGSRWAALILLILTMVAGLWFYVQGAGGWQKLTDGFSGMFAGWGGESTYVYEKR